MSAPANVVAVTITMPRNALHEAYEFHAEKLRGRVMEFAVLEPVIRIEAGGQLLTEVPDHVMWRISDLEEGWLAGVFSASLDYDTPDPVLVQLLGVANPQIMYPTLSDLSVAAFDSDTGEIAIPTALMLGDWPRNMDRFVVAQEVDGPFTHGWGEPVVRHFPAVASRRYDRYI